MFLLMNTTDGIPAIITDEPNLVESIRHRAPETFIWFTRGPSRIVTDGIAIGAETIFGVSFVSIVNSDGTWSAVPAAMRIGAEPAVAS